MKPVKEYANNNPRGNPGNAQRLIFTRSIQKQRKSKQIWTKIIQSIAQG